jgi:hypothetical protein
LRLDDPAAEDRHLSLSADGEALHLEAFAPITVNDVQVRGPADARAGDVIRIGSTTLLVQVAVPVASQPVLAHEAFVALLTRELAEPGVEAGTLAIVAADEPHHGARLVGDLAPGLRELWFVGTPPREDRALGLARLPVHGRTPHALIAAALTRLAPDGAPHLEPSFSDPAMVALDVLLERYLRAGTRVTVFGEPGIGKRTWLASAVRRAGLQAPRLDSRSELPRLEERVRAAAGGWLMLDRPDLLPPQLQELLARLLGETDAPRFVAALTASPDELLGSGRLVPPLHELLSRVVLRVPALRERPGDLGPLTEAILERARRTWRRPVVTLGANARTALMRYPFPGNLPELEVALLRGAKTAPSDEIRAVELPAEIAALADPESVHLRGALKAAERDALLAVLARTEWNVTEAARELGLPRRTLVYRMRRLALRRPRRGP